MNKPELDKIAVAIIEKYGIKEGTELLVTMLQEIFNPAEVRIVPQPVYDPYPLTGYSSSFSQADKDKNVVTCNATQQKSM